MDARGKVALITGSARGLGKGYAEALLQRGAQVVLTDILEECGHSTEAEFRDKYGAENVIFVKGDVTSDKDMTDVFDTAAQKFHGLNILICNAGIGPNMETKLTFDINVLGVIRCCELALERMRTDCGGRGGVIVNISSLAGLVTVGMAEIYHSTKHAVAGYTGSFGKRLAAEGSGVRMVALCPGRVKTHMMKWAQEMEATDIHYKEKVEKSGGWVPMSKVVDTCMRLIETEVPGGSLVRVDNLVVGIAERDQETFLPLP